MSTFTEKMSSTQSEITRYTGKGGIIRKNKQAKQQTEQICLYYLDIELSKVIKQLCSLYIKK